MNDLIQQCTVCPRLCRHACPVATATGREAAVPSLLAGAIFAWSRGWSSPELAAHAATLCVDCGACQEACHLHAPLPDALRKVRARLVEPLPFETLAPIEGEAELLVIEADERRYAERLAQVLEQPVACLRTRDALGVHALHTPAWEGRAHELRLRLQRRSLVTADGGVMRALRAASLPARWLHEVVDLGEDLRPGCAGTSSHSCCGAAGPLATYHPEEAADLARSWLDEAPGATLADAGCAGHCRSVNPAVQDALDRFLAGVTPPEPR